MKDPARRRSKLAPLLVLGISLVLAVAVAEVATRLAGRKPFQYFGLVLEEMGIPDFHEPDPVLGWTNCVATHRLPNLDPAKAGEHVVMNVWPGGRRATSPAIVDRERDVVFLGGSFTYGWFVPDADTFAYQLQERFPAVEIHNYGTSAHGTYQSLLRLERYLAEAETTPETVVYFLNADHAMRDVARASWQQMLTRQSRRAPLPLPYCQLDENDALVRCEPQAYPVWPGSRSSALIALLQERYAYHRARGREDRAYDVSRAVLSEMNALCRANDIHFVVVYLTMERADQEDSYASFFAREGIEWHDCRSPLMHEERMKVPQDGHPNAAMNAIWADMLEEKLGTVLGGE